jgi:hypothetical protein
MRNKPVAEELRDDHFHLMIHLTVPSPSGDHVPTFVITTERHINGYMVSTGPLVAVSDLDAPFPLPNMSLLDYARGVVHSLGRAIEAETPLMVWGTKGRRMNESLIPQPSPSHDPLW